MDSKHWVDSIGWTCQQISAFVLASGDNLITYGSGAYGAGIYPQSGATWHPGYDVKEDK